MQRSLSYAQPFISTLKENFIYLHQIFKLDQKKHAKIISFLFESEEKFYDLCEGFIAHPNEQAFTQALCNFENRMYFDFIKLYQNLNAIDPKQEIKETVMRAKACNQIQNNQPRKKRKRRTKQAEILPLEIPVNSLKETTTEQNSLKLATIMNTLIPIINIQIAKQRDFISKGYFNLTISERLLSEYAKEIGPNEREAVDVIIKSKLLIENKHNRQDREIKKKLDSLKAEIASITDTERRSIFADKLKSIEWHDISLTSLSDKIENLTQTDAGTFINEINKNEAIKHRYTRTLYTKKLPSTLDKSTLYFISGESHQLRQYEVFYIDSFTKLSASKQLSFFQSSIVDAIFNKHGALSEEDIHQIATLTQLTPEYIYYNLLTNTVNSEISALHLEIIKEKEEIKTSSEKLKETYNKSLGKLNKIRKILKNIKEHCYDTTDFSFDALINEASAVEKENNETLEILLQDPFILKNKEEAKIIQTQLNKLDVAINTFATQNYNRILQKYREVKLKAIVIQKNNTINQAIKKLGKEIADFETLIDDYEGLVHEYGSTYKKYKEKILSQVGVNVTDLQSKLKIIESKNDELNAFVNDNKINGQLNLKDLAELQKLKESYDVKAKELIQLISHLNTLTVEANNKYEMKKDVLIKQKEKLINHKNLAKLFAELKNELDDTESKFNSLTRTARGDFLKKTEYLDFFKSEHKKDLKEEIDKYSLILNKGKEIVQLVMNTLKAAENADGSVKTSANDDSSITSFDIITIQQDIAKLSLAKTSLSQITDNHRQAFETFSERIKDLKRSAIDKIREGLKELDTLLAPSLTFQKNYNYNEINLAQTETNKALIFSDEYYDAIQSGTIFKLIDHEPNPSLYIQAIKDKFFEELIQKKQLIIKDNQFIIDNWTLPERLAEIGIEKIVKKLSLGDEYGLPPSSLNPYTLKVNESLLDNPLLDREAAKAYAILIKNNYLFSLRKGCQDILSDEGVPNFHKIQQIEDFISHFKALDKHLKNIKIIVKANLETVFSIKYSDALEKNFKREIIEHYVNSLRTNENNLEANRSLHDNIKSNQFFKKKEILKIKDNYAHLQKIINGITKLLDDKTLASNKNLSSLDSLLKDLKDNLSQQVTGQVCVEQLEQGILKIYANLKSENSIFKNDPLYDKLEHLIKSKQADSLHLAQKYGSSLLTSSQDGVPNIAQIRHVQHKGFGEAVKKLRLFDHEENPILAFFKQCFHSAKDKQQNAINQTNKLPDMMTYLKQKNYHFGDIDLLNLDKPTQKDKARMRIVIKTIIEEEEHAFIKSTEKLKALKNLISPAQLKKDQEKHPFTCLLQEFMITFSPNNNNLETNQRGDFIDDLIKDLKKLYIESIELEANVAHLDKVSREEEIYRQEMLLLSKMSNCINTCYSNLDIALDKPNYWPWYLKYNIFAKERPQSNAFNTLKSFKNEVDTLLDPLKKKLKVDEEIKNNENKEVKYKVTV